MCEFKYNFPLIIKKIPKRKQIEKIFEELIEFLTASDEEEKYMELLDALHVLETYIRHNMDINKINEAKKKVIEKNRKRGYYAFQEDSNIKENLMSKWLKNIKEIWKETVNQLSDRDFDRRET